MSFKKSPSSWAEEEFDGAHFKDKRIKTRVIKLVDRFSELPESPINQVCLDWAETEAAYRFFRNERVSASDILASHIDKTVDRAIRYPRILVIQDTSYYNYSDHPKTKGLGILSRKKGAHVKEILGKGLIMHTAFAITEDGLPLGILDQKIFACKKLPKKKKERKKRSHNVGIPIEEKESFRWIESLVNSNYHMGQSQTRMITTCDREADIYDFLEHAHQLKTSVLVRANQDRVINKTKRHSVQPTKRLWKHMNSQPVQGQVTVEIPSRGGKYGSIARQAILDLRFSEFMMSPPRLETALPYQT